ncbi:hypothetical protein [Deinococcus humi]|uniref:Uncharacterized protein n=1 Tax=Deinococcus humi TaxID=662880 RepID=A0A7W8NJ74_9DEIO|nr:hypothetical protein [Deinococcus humi]MBB5365837.1 hypothetical protein [Deinococcus humi]GGO39409.1 hypothetical protein GCM10008949_47500 [Deinococcus humi]
MPKTDLFWPPPGLSEVQARSLLEHARAERRVRGEFQEAEAVISDLWTLDWTEAEWAVKGDQT